MSQLENPENLHILDATLQKYLMKQNGKLLEASIHDGTCLKLTCMLCYFYGF
jgi:hypothetical protein